MEVQTQLISPRYGLSVIGCVQDSISGLYTLTKRNDIDRKLALDLLAATGIEDFSRLPKREKVSGKEIVSVLLPEDFMFFGEKRSSAWSLEGKEKEDITVIIKDGKLLSGILDRNNLGEGSGLLLRTIHKKYGKEFSLELLGKLFRLGIEVLLRLGFSVIISDTDLPEKARQEIKETLAQADREVEELISLYHNNKLDTFPGRTLRETLELKILEV